MIHTVKAFDVVNKAELDAFLDFSCFFYDPMDIGNLISGSSTFFKSSLNIWKFRVHVLLKLGLDNFRHYLLTCHMRAIARQFEHSLAVPFLEIAIKMNFSSPVVLLSFQNLLTY